MARDLIPEFSRLPSANDLSCIVICDFRVPVSRALRCSSVSDPVLGIVGGRTPRQIRDDVIERVPVEVTNNLVRFRKADECEGDKAMDVSPCAVHGEDLVTPRTCVAVQKSPPDVYLLGSSIGSRADSAQIADLVDSDGGLSDVIENGIPPFLVFDGAVTPLGIGKNRVIYGHSLSR